ncbi:MAG: pseudouridine synthase [Candidatus Saccharimonadales bacterium]
MRINKYIAQATDLSRRSADTAIDNGRVRVNGQKPDAGAMVGGEDVVTLDGAVVSPPKESTTIIFNKPVGYVCSREGQGSKTIYDILPTEYQQLNSVGRLDKDSSGLLLLTNDGQLAQELTHPSYQKDKIYELQLDRQLTEQDRQRIEQGIELEDGISKFSVKPRGNTLVATLQEGRNRQIRRTFEALGYTVTNLHRTHFGPYQLENLDPGSIKQVTVREHY